jgi:peptide methionine sulfoxide reductase MsrB
MSAKEHGTSHTPVQKNLRWGCNWDTADEICNYNRHYAEHSGYFLSTSFPAEASETDGTITFYDSNTGKPLFEAPKGRTMKEFLAESRSHGWPSFRDDEVNWEYVRVLKNGETVSVDGTHLGHNLPDRSGNRYCINLVSVAGNPEDCVN